MFDYSRAENSKNAKKSFVATAENIINEINILLEEYTNIWIQLENLRKQRAAIIENVIKIIKDSGIKLAKPLGRCNNDEIIEELSKIVDLLPFKEREEVQVAIVRINNRYQEILKFGAKLDQLTEELAKTRVKESDTKEEVMVSLNDYKKKKSTQSNNSQELVRVEKITKAHPEIIKNLEYLLDSKKEKEAEKNNDENSKSDYELPNLVTTDEKISEEKLDIANDNLALEKYLEDLVAEIEDVDFALHTMKDDQTLAAIAKNVYGEEKYWENLYNYKENKDKIDKKAEEYKMSVETAVHAIDILTGLELKFPTELVTYEEIRDKSLGRVA